MNDDIEKIGEKSACPYGIDWRCTERMGSPIATIGDAGFKWRLSPDELREIADEVEAVVDDE